MSNIIEFKNVTKTFLDGKIIANKDISFGVKKGTIHALAGENGAGKSTLLSMLFGLYHPTSGEIFVRGKKINYKSAADAMRDGLGMVQQHFQLVEKYSIGQNILLGKEKTILGFVRKKEDFNKIDAISKKYGFGIKSKQKISSLTVGQEQKTEILKLLFSNAEILIFDEPTAMLTPSEIDELLEVMIKLKNEGKTIILITHKLDEIKKVADVVSVIRRGEYIGDIINTDITPQKLSRMMIGSDLVDVQKEYSPGNEVMLEVKKLIVKDVHQSWLSINYEKIRQNNLQNMKPKKHLFFDYYVINLKSIFELIALLFKQDIKFKLKKIINKKAEIEIENIDSAKLKSVSFELKSNEILAIAGVEGNGQSELANAILGLTHLRGGSIVFHNDNQNIDITKFSIKKRNQIFSSVPEDRHKYGLILDMKISENMVLKNFEKNYSKWGFILNKKISYEATKIIKKFDVRGTDNGHALARGLSGGNQQKAVVGREISSQKDVMIVFQATRGLDIGAINYIHEQIINCRNEGKAILLISYDLNEVIKLADRVLVMNSGKFTGELVDKAINRENLGILMSAKGGN